MVTVDETAVRADRSRRATRTRQRILDAAVRLFAEQGYDATSLSDIARDVGLTKAAVYYHFHSKLDILRGLLDPVDEAMSDVYRRAALESTQRRRIRVVIDGVVDVIISQRRVMAVVARDPAMHNDMTTARDNRRGREEFLRVMYGDQPTVDQEVAAHAGASLIAAAAVFDKLSDDDLRGAIERVLTRLFIK